MGSCVSRSGAMSTPAESVAVPVHALPTAKVVDLDGSMAQFAGAVTAHEALAATTAAGGGVAPSPSSRFLCCSDALDFDAPIAALAAHDALRPGQLYFALPMPMLGRPLSAQDMAALAVKACAALGTAPVVAATDDVGAAGSVPPLSSSSLETSVAGAAASNGRQRWQATGRVAPLVVVVSADAHGEWKSYYPVHGGGYKDARKAARGGGETDGKTRNGFGGYKGAGRDLASSVQRLSVIVEAASE